MRWLIFLSILYTFNVQSCLQCLWNISHFILLSQNTIYYSIKQYSQYELESCKSDKTIQSLGVCNEHWIWNLIYSKLLSSWRGLSNVLIQVFITVGSQVTSMTFTVLAEISIYTQNVTSVFSLMRTVSSIIC